ncbi:MAG: phosphoribosylanthranilate isomerase [Kordiimonadaceae bacterium]|nr:phosphoribosylanthranilate isomerase [Kordiimonadaceae bacterium]MBO6567937.1 phosphoribosylanthranilate isomerase [Kordiimonadaceae bacterium]MBO6964333.1 phosphoribosylanthranilate isomerase [Kordiimonadaceae bacterium]
MSVDVKICGLSTPETVAAAAEAGAAYLGFMFFEPSPRNLSIQAATGLSSHVPKGPGRVGVFVDADDALIDSAIDALELNWLQLHGKESPNEVARLKERTGLKVMKAIGVSNVADVDRSKEFFDVADAMLFDAKPPKGSVLPGGNAVSFPWAIMQQALLPQKWMLAGGLNPDNLAEAVKLSQAAILDVSSGVESAPGVKSKSLIEAFLRAAKAAR